MSEASTPTSERERDLVASRDAWKRLAEDRLADLKEVRDMIVALRAELDELRQREDVERYGI